MKTALYDHHVALGAKMVDFCGWSMPVQYQGIIPEHHAVRNAAGLFDVSHMGRIIISGVDAEPFLDYLSTNIITGKPNFSATYTVWPNHQGGCVDDVIVYKQSSDHFFVIVNASNRQKDLAHMKKEASNFKVEIKDCFLDGILAIQGPKARSILTKIFPDAAGLTHMQFALTSFMSKPLYLSCTGYTGEDGFEIYAANDAIIKLWETLLAEGKSEGLVPVGLGARDTLRLEKGYALYGHEITDDISSIESVSAWTVKLNKPNFLAKQQITELKESPNKRHEYGIILTEPGIARADNEIYRNGHLIGRVTSGTHSPTLTKAIAIILVNQSLSLGDFVDVKIRNKFVKAQIIKLPFVK